MAASFDWNLTTADILTSYAGFLQGADSTVLAGALDTACADVNRAFRTGGMDPSTLTDDDLSSGAAIVGARAVVIYHQRATGNLSRGVQDLRRESDATVKEIRKGANDWLGYASTTGINTMTTMLDDGVSTTYADNMPVPGDHTWAVW